jgi:hypothetical protein
MEELRDYDGEFRSDLKLEYFSKDILVRLWRAASYLYMGFDGLWYDLVKDKLGEETANEWHAEVWLKRGGCEIDVARVRQALRIDGDDVATLFKVLQVDPGTAGVIDIRCELRDNNHGVLTATRCRPLEAFERAGDAAKQRHSCEEIEVPGLLRTAQCINPKITCRPLKLPPRKSKDEIACQWEFEMKQE